MHHVWHRCDHVASTEGMLLGGSAGTNLAAAAKLAGALSGPATIVAILPDSGIKWPCRSTNPSPNPSPNPIPNPNPNPSPNPNHEAPLHLYD